MLRNADAEALMQNARAAQAEGERLWAAGDWRNAAEQGWQAVLNATAALALALEVNGKLAEPKGLGDRRVSAISGSISDLAQERGGEWEDLDGRISRAYVDLYFSMRASTMTTSATWCGMRRTTSAAPSVWRGSRGNAPTLTSYYKSPPPTGEG